MKWGFLSRTEPYHQSKPFANCQFSLTEVVLTEMYCTVKTDYFGDTFVLCSLAALFTIHFL